MSVAELAPPLFTQVLFATDFSECSDAALPYARSVARGYGARLCLAHVSPPINSAASPVTAEMWPADTQLLAALHDSAEKRLNELISAPEMQGIAASVCLTEGDPADTLLSLVAEQSADLIVMGTHGRHGLGKFIMGSVADTVLRRVQCPVLVVGPGVTSRHPATTVRNILFATDFTPEAEGALKYAISLAREHRAQLTLLSVLAAGPDAVVGSGVWTATGKRLRGLVPAFDAEETKLHCVVDFGPAADVILRQAKERDADIIVLGGRGGGRQRPGGVHQSGRVTYKVASEAACAVLTVPIHDPART